MKAYLKNYRQAPRKVRLIADSIRGKQVSEVLTQLSFMPHKAAEPLIKLIKSAVANAKQKKGELTEDVLYIKTITVDKGRTFTRFMPRAFGRATPINRESSHIEIVLDERAPKKKAATKEVVAETSEPAPAQATKVESSTAEVTSTK
jgi:large subunit ribosomal protein L22